MKQLQFTPPLLIPIRHKDSIFNRLVTNPWVSVDFGVILARELMRIILTAG
jgi:hypothetical protein